MESCATQRQFRRILLTGPPGIGKTTICKKIAERIRGTSCTFDGFYTEEVRSENKTRIGFDVVPLKQPDKRVFLARIGSAVEGKKPSKYKVGNYQVFVEEFEKSALPTLQSQSDLLIIDEIGKMELFSQQFYDIVENLFFSKIQRKFIIATIPAKNKIPQRYVNFFDEFYRDNNCKIIEINRQNRDELPDKILDIINKI